MFSLKCVSIWGNVLVFAIFSIFHTKEVRRKSCTVYTYTLHVYTFSNTFATASNQYWQTLKHSHSHRHTQTLLSHSTIRVWPRVLQLRSHTIETKTNKQDETANLKVKDSRENYSEQRKRQTIHIRIYAYTRTYTYINTYINRIHLNS